MATQRLTNAMREDICDKLVSESESKAEKIKSGLSDLIVEFHLDNTPKNVRDLWDVYPIIFNTNTAIYIERYICKEELFEGECLYDIVHSFNSYLKLPTLPIYYDYSGMELQLQYKFAKSGNYKTFIQKVQEWVRLCREVKRLRRMIVCTLEKISTVNSLKNQFPEAYEAHIELQYGPQAKDPCTRIEELRAILNSKE